jgi:hypothetical protein
LERQKTAELQERLRAVLAWTGNSNVGKQSDSHLLVDDEVVSPPNKTSGMKEESLEDPPKPILLPAAQVLNFKTKEREPINSVVVPNKVPPTSPNGGDDRDRLLPPTHLLRNENLRKTQPGAVAVAGALTGPTSPSIVSESRGHSSIDEQFSILGDDHSTIMGKLAEPSQEDEEL